MDQVGDVELVLSDVHPRFFRFKLLEGFEDLGYDPRGKEGDATVYQWFKFQLHDLRRSFAEGNGEKAYEYFRRKYGEVNEVISNIRELEDKIIRANLPVVSSIAKSKFSRGAVDFLLRMGHDMADLISESYGGAFRALENFNPYSGYSITTCLCRGASNALVHLMRKASRDVRIRLDPSKRVHNANEGISAVERLANEKGKESSALNRQVGKNEKANGELLCDAVGSLPYDERVVLEKRYGLNGQRPIRQRDISQELGVSYNRVRKIQYAAQRRVKRFMEQEKD